MRIKEKRTTTIVRTQTGEEISKKTDEVDVGKLCDCCKKPFPKKKDTFDVCSTTIRASTGTKYPECGSGEEYSPDVCIDCFIDKVIPALAAIGIEVPWVEWES